jgi:UDP:flavonoid glycosyltransferase YjiC (YdhE family)
MADGGQRKRILLTTFGSLGDLYPYLAIALGLKARGHDPIIATSAGYEQMVRNLDLDFHAVRPDVPDPASSPEQMRLVMDERRGTEEVLQRWVLPALRDANDDLDAASAGVDLMVTHILTFAAPLVAERRGIPWVSTALQPGRFFSAYDPPLFARTEFFARKPFLGPWFWCPYRRLASRLTRSLFTPLYDFRADLGLPPSDEVPVIDGQSPFLVLALFSPVLAQTQPDWPPQTVVTGFPFFEPPGGETLPPELAAFLDTGSPPIVFTLGSSAVYDPGRFYEDSAEAARRLGQRAVLLVGRGTDTAAGSWSKEILAVEYAPHASLFPRAAAIVHQGGIGTTAQAMRSARPMVVVPFAHDQPDNARRLQRLGISRTIPRREYTVERVTRELRQVLDEAGYGQRAREVGRQVREEDGVGAACDALERLLRVT